MFVDRTRVVCPAADLSVEPDGVVVTHAVIDTGRAVFVPATGQATSFVEIEGGPDLVVEIGSDASVHKDSRRLPPAYHAAGVAEFWIVDARVQPLSFRVLRRGQQEYEMAQPLADGRVASPVLGPEVRLVVHDTPRGTPRYDLQIRESSTDRPRG